MEFELSQLKKKFDNLPAENQQVQISLEYLQALVSRVNELYQSSRIDEKRQILKLVFYFDTQFEKKELWICEQHINQRVLTNCANSRHMPFLSWGVFFMIN